MAKARDKVSPASEERAWELFAASIKVGGVATVTPDHLARECFQLAAVFEAVADEFRSETPKG